MIIYYYYYLNIIIIIVIFAIVIVIINTIKNSLYNKEISSTAICQWIKKKYKDHCYKFTDLLLPLYILWREMKCQNSWNFLSTIYLFEMFVRLFDCKALLERNRNSAI